MLEGHIFQWAHDQDKSGKKRICREDNLDNLIPISTLALAYIFQLLVSSCSS